MDSLEPQRKQEKKPIDLDKVVAPAASKFKEAPDEIKKNCVGTLYTNATVADAEFTDLFEGEQLEQARHLYQEAFASYFLSYSSVT